MSEIGKSSPDPTCLVMIMFCTVSTVACIFCMFQIYLHVHWCWAANITGSFGSICKEFLRRLRSLIFYQHDIGRQHLSSLSRKPLLSGSNLKWSDGTSDIHNIHHVCLWHFRDISEVATSMVSPIHRNKLSPTSGTNSPPLFLPDPAKPWPTRTRQIKEQKKTEWIVDSCKIKRDTTDTTCVSLSIL